MKKKLVMFVLVPAVLATGGLAAGDGAAAQTGSIHGVVITPPPRPARRTPSRYARGARTPQDMPTVVYLVGPLDGVASSSGNAATPMVQIDTAFTPSAVFVPVGGSIDFPNTDSFFHNVFSYSQTKRFDLGRYPRGESKTVSFEQPGLVEVFCEVHEFMRAVIVVTQNPFHAEVDADGGFTLTGVPPGEHTLAVWHPRYGTSEVTAIVTSGTITTLEVELGG